MTATTKVLNLRSLFDLKPKINSFVYQHQDQEITVFYKALNAHDKNQYIACCLKLNIGSALLPYEEKITVLNDMDRICVIGGLCDESGALLLTKKHQKEFFETTDIMFIEAVLEKIKIATGITTEPEASVEDIIQDQEAKNE